MRTVMWWLFVLLVLTSPLWIALAAYWLDRTTRKPSEPKG